MNRKLSVVILITVLVVSYQSVKKRHVQVLRNIPAIDSLIVQQIENQNISGAVVRVQKGDSIWHRAAYGYATKYNMKLESVDHPEKMKPGTMFDLASLTKVCATTFGIMILVDQGKIHLNDPIYKWLPEFKRGEKKKITIRNLLTHSAGLYQWKPTYYFASNRREQYEYIAGLPLKWEVGERRHYSDLGFILLGDIIERITEQPLDQYLQNHLYKPLDLDRTVFNPLKKGFQNIAATSHGNPFEQHMVYDDSFGYDVDADSKSWDRWRDYTLRGEVSDGNAWYTRQGVSGHAGLFSTADDLQRLIDLLLDKGKYEGKKIISSAVIDTFLTKDRFDNGLGWAMDTDVIHAKGAPQATFGHTGFTGTSIVVIPKYQLSVILLTNRENAGLQPSGYYSDLEPLRQKLFNIVWHSFKKN